MLSTCRILAVCALLLAAAGIAPSQNAKQPPTPAQSITGTFHYVNKQLLDMANDFPAAKYDYRPTKEMRSFGEVLLHIMAGNTYAAKIGRGIDAKWDAEEVDPKKYHGKDEIVAAFQKSVDDANATLKSIPPERFSQSVAPWLAVIEHSGEHYGLLVAYYRLNGIVPPASRPQK